MKFGIDVSRENFTAQQEFTQLGKPAVFEKVAQPGTQFGAYGEDKWSPSQEVTVDCGVRYDHSTGFVGGDQISPRIGVNVAPDDRNVVHYYHGRFYAAPQLEDVSRSVAGLVALVGDVLARRGGRRLGWDVLIPAKRAQRRDIPAEGPRPDVRGERRLHASLRRIGSDVRNAAGRVRTGYPVEFQNGSGRLPAHMTFDLALGRAPGQNGVDSLGYRLDVDNLLDHQFIWKIANGFNATQIAAGRQFLFRVITPF